METPMTPEERYIKLENLMQTVIEAQAVFSEQQAALTERQAGQASLIEQDQAAIRDLIAVSRTLVDAQVEIAAKVKALTESVREHEGRIEALIDTVDRIIRRDDKPR